MAHKHAKLMMEYAKDAAVHDKPWKLWEMLTLIGEWVELECHPRWYAHHVYRRKPRTININGIEVPAPVREDLNRGDIYFAVDFAEDCNVYDYTWAGDSADKRMMSNGVIHLTKEAAIQHSKALISFTRQDDDK